MLKIGTNFKLDPKKMSDQVLRAMADRFKKIASSVRCPEHGETAKITPRPSPRGKLNYDIAGCCEKLKKAVEEKLRRS